VEGADETEYVMEEVEEYPMEEYMEEEMGYMVEDYMVEAGD
jgi:hypothetical protein